MAKTCSDLLKKNKAYLAIVFVQLAYAGMAFLSKAAIAKGMNPYVFVAYRQAFATVFLAPFAFFMDRKRDDPLTYGLMLNIFLISLVGITLSLNLYTYALNYVSATFASASINTVPALTFLIAVIFRIETFSLRKIDGLLKILGCVVTIFGAMVFAFVKGPEVNFLNSSSKISYSTMDHSSNNKNWVQGCLIMLSANAAWASRIVLQVPLVKQYPAKIRLTMFECVFSCIQSFVWVVAMERNISSWKLQWDLNLFAVAYCGIVVTGISYWLQLLAVEDKGPLFTSSFTPLTLIITAIFSAFLWNEILCFGSICGGMLLIGGLFCILWGKNKEVEKDEIEVKQDLKEEAIV